MYKLGIVGAMDEEIDTLLRRLQNCQKYVKSGTTFYSGILNGVDTVIVKCGIGKVNAAICAQQLVDLFEITHLINTGIAGSLSAQLDIGDLVISQDVIYHDFDCTHFGYAYGQVPGTQQAAFIADEYLIKCAISTASSQHDFKSSIGRITSGDQFIDSRDKKERIISNTNALCTEMEGAAIAHTAFRNQVPFVIIRAISDKADDSAQMDYPTFEKMAAFRCAEVILGMTEIISQGT